MFTFLSKYSIFTEIQIRFNFEVNNKINGQFHYYYKVEILMGQWDEQVAPIISCH